MNIQVGTDILKKLGLSKKEIKIYAHLAQSGVQSIQQVSKETGINRTTVYRYLEILAEKDLIEWIIDSRGKKVQATPPNNLRLLLTKKKQKLESLEQLLPSFITDLQEIKPVQKFKTQVRYYKGVEGIKQMIWNTLQTKETLRSFTPFGRRDVIDSDFEDKFELEWSKRGLKDKIITNETRKDYIKNKLVPLYRKTLNIRVILSSNYYIANDITLYNDIIAINSFDKENLVGVEIENAEMAKSLKSIFEIVWGMAEPL